MDLVFLAYLPDGSLLIPPTPSYGSVKFAAQAWLKSHPTEAVKVYGISDGHPTYEATIHSSSFKFKEKLRAMAASR